MTSSDEPEPESEIRTPRVVIEGCDWSDIGLDVALETVPELLAWCAGVIGMIAVDVERVELVLTADFVQSVRDRTLSEYYRENYDVERGTGTVGGKTMKLEDGSIAVLLPAACFVSADGEDDPAERENVVKRTTVHEAQHVAMEQRLEGPGDYVSESWARRNILSVADSVIGEYRAELGVAEFGGFEYQGWDFVEVLNDFQARLRGIDDDYQVSHDVPDLSVRIGTQAAILWRTLGYLAAFVHDPAGGSIDLPAEWTEEPIWQGIVGDHWAQFTAALDPMPGGRHEVSRRVLDAAVNGLADVLQDWLRGMGFSFTDIEDGWRFDIVDRNLLNN